MKIYTLENKNEVLAILTHQDNMSYREFKRICVEANEEAENDFYVLKDILVNDYKFILVEACGSFEVNKKKGSI
jgi:CDP-glycerol glycerophosphotransferase (TagB/SpsB family)